MEKIGVCACYDTRNYGSMLQSLATQIVIDDLGYESEFIVYKKKKDIKFILKQIPRLLNANLMYEKVQNAKKKFQINLHKEVKNNVSVREKAFLRFQDQYYKKFSDTYYGYEELKKKSLKYDSVVVGSDQLWLPAGLASNFYNLMFVDDSVNKVAYATSFGVSKIPFYQKNRTKKYLERINYLSVREKKGAEIVKSISGRDAKVVADPTLLLKRNEWDNVIENKRYIEGPYIFCYFLGTNIEHRSIANELKKKTGLPIVCTPFLDNFVRADLEFGDYCLCDIGPDDFVNLIRNSEYILTDSFHGSVFSIIYNKKFVVFNRFNNNSVNSRNSRIESLCDLLGLEERRYNSDIFKTVSKDIDYSNVNRKLDEIRNESISYLKYSLGKENINE